MSQGTIIFDITANDRQLLRDMQKAGIEGGKAFNKGFGNSSALALGRITGKSNEFQKSLEASNARVIAFGASAGAIFAVKSAFEKLLTSTIEVEKQLNDIDSILQLGGGNLQRFATQLFAVANSTSMAFSEAAKAATELSRQGLSVEETLKRTAAALSLSRLSGMGVEESVSSLTATLNSFTREALDAETVINRLTAVDAQYAVSADDLAKALSRVSASANDAKVSFNETIALVTAAQQITARGGSVIGNAFKSIFTRLQRPQVLDDLESAGVQVRNLQGQVLPMISVLKNLSSSYDTLSSAQKSFVSETVGGVYQVNVLKAVLKDVGNGVSVFDGAMSAAANSSGSADRRLKALNSTISSQLVRTMNELTRASSNVGEALLGPGLKSGISGFETVFKRIANLADQSNANQGSALGQAGATLFQGAAKSFGNILQGPGVQFLLFTLSKLLDRLATYAIGAVKDLDNVNNQEKERLALNEGIAAFLAQEKDLYQGILDGTISATQGIKAYYEYVEASANKLKVLKDLSSAMGGKASGEITITSVGSGSTRGAARGYIPNVTSEIEGARRGGYRAGSVVQTIVNSGNSGVPIIANTAETKSTVVTGKFGSGRAFDFINPPKDSPAGKKHQAEALRKTGIDPYALPQMPVYLKSFMPSPKASGHIPNLSIADVETRFKEMGITDWRKDIGLSSTITAGKNYPKVPDFDLDWVPESFLQAIGKHLSTPQDVQAVLHFAQNKIYDTYRNLPEDVKGTKQEKMRYAARSLNDSLWSKPDEVWDSMRTSIIRQDENTLKFLRKGKRINKENFATFITSATGKPFDPPTEQVEEEAVSLGPDTVKNLLNRYAKTIPTVAAYKSVNDFSVPQDMPDYKSTIKAGNENYSFNTPIYGHKTFVGKNLQEAQMIARSIKKSEDPALVGQMMGILFDERTKEQAQELGAHLSKDNSILDLPFPFKKLLQEAGISQDVSGIELKSSLTEAMRFAGSKAFRSIIGDPSSSKWTGPIETPYHLAGAPEFKQGAKTGILDYAMYGNESRNQMFVDAIQGLASGKALNIVHSPSMETLGKMRGISAKMAGGENYVRSPEDIAQVDQLIWNSSVRSPKSLRSGPTGLMFALASQIHGVGLPKTGDENQMANYRELEEILKQRVGQRYIGGHSGVIPNLSIHDSFGSMQSLVNNQKMFQEVSSQADAYVKSISPSLGDKLKRMDREFLVAGLTSGAMGRPYASDLSVLKKSSGFSDSLFEVLLEQFTNQVNVPELSKRIKLGEFSGGMIQQALMAENVATGGNAILSSSDLLKSAGNPAGLAAIDKRSQGNADEAIQQHMSLGQSLSKIKMMRTGASGGLVPNLAISDNEGFFTNNSVLTSAFLGIAAFGTQAASSSDKLDKWKMKLGNLIPLQEQQEVKIRQLNKSYQKAHEELISTGKTTFNEKPYVQSEGGVTKMFDAFKEQMGGLDNDAQRIARKNKREQIDSNRALGYKIAFGAGAAGGIVGATANRFSPDAGAAIDEFSMGIQTAGQVLSAFPNVIGKSLAIGTSFTAAASAINVWSQGLAKSRKEYEVSQSKFQKLSAQIDGVVVAMNSYDNLLNDSSVSLETLVRESRKFNETLAAMGQTEEGQKALTSVVGAPDNRTKANALVKFREEQARELELQANLLSLKEYSTKKTFLGLGKPLGYQNDVEKNEINQITKNLTGSGIASLTDSQKSALLAASENTEEFASIVDQTNGKFKDFLDSLTQIVGKKNAGKIVSSMRENLATEKTYNSPEAVAQLKGLKERNAQRQLTLDSAIRNEASVRRLFVNQGSMRAGNVLDIRAMEQRNRYDTNSIEQARRQANTGVYQLQYGERSVRAYQTGGELNRIESERQNKSANVENQTTRQISEMLTQSFDEYIKHPDLTNAIGVAGQTNIAQVPEFKTNFIQALNKGIESTVKRGDFSRFSENGSFNTTKLIDEIKRSSSGDSKIQQSVSDFLQNQNSKEILEVIKNANNELVTINREAYTEAQKQTASFEGFRSEMDFKQLSSFMGGVRNLLDRSTRRSTERDAVRNLALLRRGTTSEIRGMGGAGLLDFFKKQNVPIDLSGKTSLSKLMIEAWKASTKGIEDTQKKSLGRIIGSSTRLNGGNDLATLGIKEFGRVNFAATADAALKAEYKPENSDLSKMGFAEITNNTQVFKSALDNSSESVRKFSTALNKSAQDVQSAIQRTFATRTQVEAEGKKDSASLPINKRQEQAALRRQLAEMQNGPSDDNKTSFPFASWIPQGGGTLVAALAGAYFGRKGIGQGLKQLPGTLARGGRSVLGGIKSVGTYRGVASETTRNLLDKTGGVLFGPQDTMSARERSIIEASSKQSQAVTLGQQLEADSARMMAANDRSFRRSLPQAQRDALAKSIRAERAVARANNRGFESAGKSSPYLSAGRNSGSFILLPKVDLPPQGKQYVQPTFQDLEEIRRRGLTSKGDIQKAFPQVKLSREDAGYWKTLANKGVGQPIAPMPVSKMSSGSPRGPIAGFAGGMAPMGMPMMGGVGGFATTGGGMALSYGLQAAGANVGGRTGTALMIGSAFAPQIAESVGTKLGPLLARGGFGIGGAAGIGAGGGALTFGSLGVAGTLGVGALGAGAAYGGYKIGQGIYNKASGLGKLNTDFAAASDETSVKRLEFVQKRLRKGGSVQEIKQMLLKEMEKNNADIKTVGGGGVYSNISGQGKIADTLKKSNEDIKELINHLADLKEQSDAQKHNQELEDKQNELIEKQEELIDAQIAFFKGGGNAQTGAAVASNMKIEISIKDADKIPDALMEKLINPLKKQLGDLQSQTNILVNKQSPQPAKV